MCKSSGRDTIAAVAFLFNRQAYIILLQKQVAHLFCSKTKNSPNWVGPAAGVKTKISGVHDLSKTVLAKRVG